MQNKPKKTSNLIVKKDRKNEPLKKNKSITYQEEREDIVIGRNAVMEALKGDRTIEAIYVYNNKL